MEMLSKVGNSGKGKREIIDTAGEEQVNCRRDYLDEEREDMISGDES